MSESDTTETMYRQFAEVEERKVRTACGKVDDIDTNGHDAPVTLTYFTGRGRATIVRLMLVAAGIKVSLTIPSEKVASALDKPECISLWHEHRCQYKLIFN